jgi:hypothetical protein
MRAREGTAGKLEVRYDFDDNSQLQLQQRARCLLQEALRGL